MRATQLQVYLLNFHGIHSHLEVLIKNPLTQRYYVINRWEQPTRTFISERACEAKARLTEAGAIYAFTITAVPQVIVEQWRRYYAETAARATICGSNCADAAQWFLTTICQVPPPSYLSLPLSINHVAVGIMLPSVVPIGLTLPGRVMSNAIFHLEIRNNPERFFQYSKLALTVCAALSYLTIAAGLIGLGAAITALSGISCIGGGLGACSVIALGGKGFFKSVNTLGGQIKAEQVKHAGKTLEVSSAATPG